MHDDEQLAILASVLRTAVDAIIIIDQKGTIESANIATERMFGFDSVEMIGQNVKMLMPSPYHEQHDGYLDRYQKTGERHIIGIGREVTGKRKDGSLFPLHLGVSEVETDQRKLFTGILRDISELKAAEGELKQLNATLDQRVRTQAAELQQAQLELVEKEKFATLGRISGGIAHEIRNPLNAIKTSAYYLLNAQSPSPQKTEEHLTRIDRQVNIIDSAVTALSDLARLPEPQASEIDIPAMISGTLRDTKLPRSIVVEQEFPANLPNAWADEKQLPIVFKNLIRNSRDAMPEGGSLQLSARLHESMIVVSVQDDGIGMPPEVAQRIAEPFFSTKARGMGLGMAITTAILEKNQCEMRLESSPNEGTLFDISIPIAGKDR
ncbi:two-component system sensor histidine kinase NtrB [Rhodopirellula bahusiensis]|uniref:Sensor protein FixL n=1 Tax=Rhodopirellula bahusiensis TaxID=2014065 RepID=A0A2G1VZV2_9BACT|nr:PAS domain S-box protein [Rhodopirellula bahusiensis]PHQ32251.1 PAS domain-containing sensor histidine kinase [Rhodopirellula bahusiensis]